MSAFFFPTRSIELDPARHHCRHAAFATALHAHSVQLPYLKHQGLSNAVTSHLSCDACETRPRKVSEMSLMKACASCCAKGWVTRRSGGRACTQRKDILSISISPTCMPKVPGRAPCVAMAARGSDEDRRPKSRSSWATGSSSVPKTLCRCVVNQSLIHSHSFSAAAAPSGQVFQKSTG